MSTPDDELRRLHADLGLAELNPTWAKWEILLGLAAAGVGIACLVYAAARNPLELWWLLAAGVGLFVFGLYLAMAGSRSHLYQSNTKLVAYLLSRLDDANTSRDTRS